MAGSGWTTRGPERRLSCQWHPIRRGDAAGVPGVRYPRPRAGIDTGRYEASERTRTVSAATVAQAIVVADLPGCRRPLPPGLMGDGC
jgi:hypothetical protein